MGACLSLGAPPHLIETTDGDEEVYHQRYIEDQVLGQGAFGVVKLVHDMRQKNRDDAQAVPLACKTLRKGATFKDNTLYSPIKPEILRGEVDILRTLAGQRYCLRMEAIFETPRVLLMVTEFCGGGEMMEYVSKQTEDLRTEDVSRIAFQLLSALDHCAKNRVIHRDLKPENIMFVDASPGAELRVIDFGSGTMDNKERPKDQLHSTFAGSAFYISPELFQRTYNQKTDVWSAGVIFYVLVSGYPSDCLQKAFNIIQRGPGRKLLDLPNIPKDMPDSFYELLEGCMEYQFQERQPAGKLLQNDFVQFHLQHEGMSIAEVAAAAAATEAPATPGTVGRRTSSLSVRGSVSRHTTFLSFKKFERSLTTILATMLSKGELKLLMGHLRIRLDEKFEERVAQDAAKVTAEAENGQANAPLASQTRQLQRLHVIKVQELKDILRDEVKNIPVLEQIEKLPDESNYGAFAYNVSLLKDFSSEGDGFGIDSAGRKRLKRRGSLKRNNSVSRTLGSRNSLTVLNDGSVHSAGSFRGNGSGRAGSVFASAAPTQQPSSVHGTNVFGGMKRRSAA